MGCSFSKWFLLSFEELLLKEEWLNLRNSLRAAEKGPSTQVSPQLDPVCVPLVASDIALRKKSNSVRNQMAFVRV